MGLFDKLKGTMNAVTGGAAKVTIEAFGNDPDSGFVPVRVGAKG